MENLPLILPPDIRRSILYEFVISQKLIKDILICIKSEECKNLDIKYLSSLISCVIDNQDMINALNKHNNVFGDVANEHIGSNKLFKNLSRIDSFSLSILFFLYH